MSDVPLLHQSTTEEMRCGSCGKPWEGTFTRTVWTELDRQDHKGPSDVAYAKCCRTRATWYGARPIPASIECRFCMDTGRRGEYGCNVCSAGAREWARRGL